jgi:hypothetical protein
MLETKLEYIRQPRLKILELLEGFSLEQLNEIPKGFNNNIIWNLGHMIAAQQGICYKRAGLNTFIDEDFFQAYKPDSKPTSFVDQEGLEHIKELLFSSLEQLRSDYQANKFSGYTAFTTRYGIALSSVDDAISFLPFHEGLHIGCIMAMRKLV